METESKSLAEELALAMLPVGMHSYDSAAPIPTDAQRQQAETVVTVMRNLIRNDHSLLLELGLERLALVSDGDKLRRPFFLYAPTRSA